MRTPMPPFLLPAVLCFIVTGAMAQRYAVTDLGPLAPTGINSWAHVVGNYQGNAYLWSKRDGMRDLGILAGGTFSRAAAINDLGAVTGTADGPGTVFSADPNYVSQNCSDLTQPFVWTNRKGMRGLGTVGNLNLPDINRIWCAVPFVGTDIDNLSQIVGYVPVNGDFYAWGFSWSGRIVNWIDPDGITVFGGSDPPTFVNSINNRGLIVGQNSVESTLFRGHATLWKAGVAIDLGTLGSGPDATGYSSAANGINDSGQIVGWSSTMPLVERLSMYGWKGETPIHALLWPRSGGMVDIGTLTGDIFSAAWKINNFGQVIGISGNTVAPPTSDDPRYEIMGRPFIWSARSGMSDLNMMIPQNSGWALTSATDINIWGQIVGSGTLNGEPRGYMLTPLNPFQVY
jgi:uncharacterized membrane protein